MPEYKSQEQKAESTLNAQPKDMKRTIIRDILDRDCAGWKMKDIAENVGLSQSRISVIVQSPIYVGMKKDRLNAKSEMIDERLVNEVVDADKVIKEAKGRAAQVLVGMLDNCKSEAVKAKVASDIVGLNKEDKGQTIIVQINEKLGERMQKVLDYKE